MRDRACLIALLAALAGCNVKIDGLALPKPSAKPVAVAGTPQPTAQPVPWTPPPSVTALPTFAPPAGTPAPFDPPASRWPAVVPSPGERPPSLAPTAYVLDGRWQLAFDPPYMGDSGLTPQGPIAKEIVIPLTLAARAGVVSGEGSWCPSDYCVSTSVAGWIEGPKVTLKLDRGPHGDAPGLALHGEVMGDTIVGEVRPDITSDKPAERRFKLVRVLPEVPPPPTPRPDRAIAGTWTYAIADTTGPVLVDACYPHYLAFRFTDPEADGRDVALDVAQVQGGGAYMPHDTEHLEGDRDERTGTWVLDGVRTPADGLRSGPTGGGEARVRYVLRLDPATHRLAGTRSLDGGSVEPIVLGPVEKAPAPAEGCGPPRP